MGRKRKFNNFGDFVLNDEDNVMPFLMSLSIWFSFIIFLALFAIMVYIQEVFLIVLFGVMLFLSGRRLFRHYKAGGSKMWKGSSANDIVWNKGGKN